MNKKLNIPIYRAKKIESDEYVEGYLIPIHNYNGEKAGYYIDNRECSQIESFPIFWNNLEKIDPSTLAIHFPNWVCIDQETEKEIKVFASLQEDKRGGSVVEIRDNFQGATGALYFREASLMFQGMHFTEAELQAFEVTGIQE